MDAILTTFVSLFILLNAEKSLSQKLAGPYNLQVFDLGECPQDEVPLDGTGSFRLHGMMHHNKSVNGPVYSGNVTIRDNIGHLRKTQIKVTASKWDSVSGWRPNFFSGNVGEACFVGNHIASDLLTHLHKNIHPNFPGSCPAENGFWEIDNVPAKMGQLKNFPQLPYGRFRLNIHAFHMKKINSPLPFTCVRISVDIVPRLKSK